MKLGIVIGKVISNRKEGNLERHPILVVRYLDAQLNETNTTVAAVDTVYAGEGEMVMLCSSSSARMTSQTQNMATDQTIIGIVDSVTTRNKVLYKK